MLAGFPTRLRAASRLATISTLFNVSKLMGRDTSSVLPDELAEVLARAHLVPVITANRSSPELLMRQYAMLAQVVIPAQINRVVEKDVDDDAVIACALAAQADWIVSGDAHLLNLKHYQGMRIIDAAQALRSLAQ